MSRLRCLQLFDGNEVVVGQKKLSPRFFFHISHKCAAKVEKKRFFDQKIAMAWRTRKTDKEMETSCTAAIDTQIA